MVRPLRASESYREFHNVVKLVQANVKYIKMSIVGTCPSIQAFADQFGHVLSDGTSTQQHMRWHVLSVHEPIAIQKGSADLHVAHANPFLPSTGRFIHHRPHHLSPLCKMAVCQLHAPNSLRRSLRRAFPVEGAQATSC